MAAGGSGRIIHSESYFQNDEIVTSNGANRHTTKRYEVYFPHTFTSCHPYGPIEPEEKKVHQIQIREIAHVTHNKQADQIASVPGYYTFKPKSKRGKRYDWDGSPMGETYKKKPTKRARYQEVLDTERLLPGRYSWWGAWGVSLMEDEPESDKDGDKSEEEEGSDEDEFKYLVNAHMQGQVADYLKNPSQSRYGNNAFSGRLSDVLQAYKRSRRATDVYLVMGGTLRYKCEICYIIIVCTQSDLAGALSEFPPLNQDNQSVFELKGLVNHEGKVAERLAVPVFKPKYINVGSGQSWETLAFAFYFKTKGEVLQCEGGIRKEKIGHDYCTSKQPPPQGGPWKCPNEL